MFDIALYEPEIAPIRVTSFVCVPTVARTCISSSHWVLIRKRKGAPRRLDYHDLARVTRHKDYAAFIEYLQRERGSFRLFACTTKTTQHHVDAQFQQGDVLLFGPETRGLPAELIASLPAEQRIRIPMMPEARSLNLSNAVAIIAFEAWRQMGFDGAR